jgi:membrane protein
MPTVVGRAAGAVAERNLAAHLRLAVDQVFDYVDQTNFAGLGVLGICGLLLAVVALLKSIEEAMNCIWKADRSRSLGRKILDFFAVMILLPLTLNLALATEAVLRSPRLFGWLQGALPLPWLGSFLLNRLPMLVVAGSFSLLYFFLPNTRVRLLPALVGGLVGGAGWFVAQSSYIGLQIGVANYNAIYGSFATLPLFLLWLYVGWIVFLLGAEVAYAIQEWPGYVRQEQLLLPSLRLALAFTVLAAVTKDFHARTVTTFHSLTERIRQPGGFIRLVLDELVRTGMLHRIEGREPAYVPASPGVEIRPAAVVDLILGNEVATLAASDMARAALAGAKAALVDKAIAWPGPAETSEKVG